MGGAQASPARDQQLPAGRDTAVLFAGIASGDRAGGAQSAGAAAKAIARVVEVLEQATQLSSGRVLTRREREVMALFATPDAAARAALRMHAYAQALPPLPENLGMRVGFHYGPVAQRGEEVFGDTVNLALELVDAAKTGQILISQEAASSLSAEVQECVRPLQHLALKAGGRILLGELAWRKVATIPSSRSSVMTLHLTYRKKRLMRRRQADTVTLGRDAECDLAIEDRGASRRHCTISRRGAKCILKDHSANGTFVAAQGRGEVTVRGEEVALSGRGVISFGRSSEGTEEVVQYVCDV